MVMLKCDKVPQDSLAITNKVFVHPDDYAKLRKEIPDTFTEGPFVQIEGFIFTFEKHQGVALGKIGFNLIQRKVLKLALDQQVAVSPFAPNLSASYMSLIKLEVDFVNKNRDSQTIEKDKIVEALKMHLCGQFLQVGQKVVTETSGTNLEITISALECMNLADLVKPDSEVKSISAKYGILHEKTVITMVKVQNSKLQLVGGSDEAPTLFKLDWNFEEMGIGGLDNEFATIFRRAFASRLWPSKIIQKVGLSHVKGILLFGPPGTGKTLMARQIGKMLNAKPPKIVKGPEILNKYVGQSEENIRNLFKEAEIDSKNGNDSQLHIIIFDEIDAICRQRGTRNDGTGVGDTVVNQLLSQIDGPESLNNILVIGMTNRKDLIDEALLRPGRFEVQMEIPLPDEKGRRQIFVIHTRKLSESKCLSSDVDLTEFARETKNYTGAEIEGVVKSATSFAFNRQIDVKTGVKLKGMELIVTHDDFMQALKEVKPAFGVDDDEFANLIPNGIIQWGPKVSKLFNEGSLFTQQVRNSPRTPLVSVLIEGPLGSGKTSIAAHLAKQSDFPFVKLISPETLVGYSETSKAAKITKIFDDAHKSQLSFIILDDLERLIDYVRIGPRFSNVVLQTLIVLIKKPPPKGRRLLVVATTSNKRVIEDTELLSSFDVVLEAPQIESQEELKTVLSHLNFASGENLLKAVKNFTPPISIKRLIMLTEMAKQGGQEGIIERFRDALNM